jgi:hypothetical protein
MPLALTIAQLGAKTEAGLSPLPGSCSTDADAQAYGDLRDPWDIVILAGQKLPGIAVVKGRGIEHQIDVKKSPGKAGATITDLGSDLGRIEIHLSMWTLDQWAYFKRIRPLIQPEKPDGKLMPVDVQHPGINAIGVSSLYVKRVGPAQTGNGRHGGDRGITTIEIECLQYAPPSTANVTHTPKSSRALETHLSGNFQTSDGRTITVKPSQDPAMIGPHSGP